MLMREAVSRTFLGLQCSFSILATDDVLGVVTTQVSAGRVSLDLPTVALSHWLVLGGAGGIPLDLPTAALSHRLVLGGAGGVSLDLPTAALSHRLVLRAFAVGVAADKVLSAAGFRLLDFTICLLPVSPLT